MSETLYAKDIGHSMNARQPLREFLVGTLDATEEELDARPRALKFLYSAYEPKCESTETKYVFTGWY